MEGAALIFDQAKASLTLADASWSLDRAGQDDQADAVASTAARLADRTSSVAVLDLHCAQKGGYLAEGHIDLTSL